MNKPIYYPAWIAPNRAQGGWSWGKACDTPAEAAAVVKSKLMGEAATMGVVVEFKDGIKTPMASYIWPPSARKIVGHWEDLWATTETRP